MLFGINRDTLWQIFQAISLVIPDKKIFFLIFLEFIDCKIIFDTIYLYGHKNMKQKTGYVRIFEYLKNKYSNQETFSLEEAANETDYKIGAFKVYYRNKLKNVYIEGEKFYKVTQKIVHTNVESFTKYLSQKSSLTDDSKEEHEYLVENSISALLACIEIHNKPRISYRYETTTLLLINSWELLLKAYISKNMSKVKLIKNDGTTKPFLECLECVVAELGKEYLIIKNNLDILYSYRCNFAHFYNLEIDVLIFSIIQKSIILYSKFIEDFFNKSIVDFDDVTILPIGIKKFISPLDYLSNTSASANAPKEVKDFISLIVEKTNELAISGEDEMIFVPFSFSYQNEKRIKNADIIAAINNEKKVNVAIKETVIITEDKDAKKVRIDEETLYSTIYTETYRDIITYCQKNILGFKANKDFRDTMRKLKTKVNLHNERLLDPNNPEGTKKSFYSIQSYEFLKNELQKFFSMES